MVMNPVQVHMHVDILVRAGTPFTKVFCDPGFQGARASGG